jgi:hypothetical protein
MIDLYPSTRAPHTLKRLCAKMAHSQSKQYRFKSNQRFRMSQPLANGSQWGILPISAEDRQADVYRQKPRAECWPLRYFGHSNADLPELVH